MIERFSALIAKRHGHAGVFQHFLGCFVKRDHCRFCRQGQCILPLLLEKSGAGFDRQLVKGQMTICQCQGLAKFRPPIFGRLFLAAIDEVKGNSRKGFSRPFQGAKGLRYIVFAAKEA